MDDGIGVGNGFNLHRLVGPAGLPVQGPEELCGGGDLHLGGGKVVIMELRMEGSVMSSARLNSSMSLTSRMGEMRVTSRRPSDRSGFPGESCGTGPRKWCC